MKRDGRCHYCGEVLDWVAPSCKNSVWVHTDPRDCVAYTKRTMETKNAEG